jgi:hypothetical protein
MAGLRVYHRPLTADEIAAEAQQAPAF